MGKGNTGMEIWARARAGSCIIMGKGLKVNIYFLAMCSAVDTPERQEDQYSKVRCANTPTRTHSLPER